MESLHPGWLIAGFIALIVIWANERLRALFILCLVIFFLMAAVRTLLRQKECGAGDCLVQLQPTWAGPCFPSNGGAVLKADGHYYLTTDPQAPGGATCVDWRFWQ